MDVFLRDALSREAVVHPPKLGGGRVGGVFARVCSLTHTRLTSLAEQSL